MTRFSIFLLLLGPFGLSAQIKNMRLTGQAEGQPLPGEPCVIINHTNPGNIVASMGNNLVVYTLDGGQTWKESRVSSPLGKGASVGLIADAKGRIYNFHRTESENPGEGYDRIICQRSDDDGKTWNEGSMFGGGTGKQNDKLGIAVNVKKQIVYAAWTQYDQYPSSDPGCKSNVMFSIGSGGKGWDKPKVISQLPGNCANDGTSIAGAMPAVAAEGRMFITWSNNNIIFFDRSYDEGETWLFNDLAIAQQQGGWALSVTGFGLTYNPPILMIDNSASRYHGVLHLVFADQRAGVNDTDIWYLRSIRYGDSWAPPVKINQDESGHHQFSPAMAIDQATGNIYIVYYDQRDYADAQTDVYLAWSTDGGSSFKEKKISETPFTASPVPFYDHTAITAHDEVIVPVWTRTDNGAISIWAAVIRHPELSKK